MQTTDVVTTTIHIVRTPDGQRTVHMPIDGPVQMGMHGGVAAHYGKEEGKYVPHATTLDYIVAAVGACMTGSFARTLAVRDISTEQLETDVVGEITKSDDGVLKISKINVT